MQIQFNQERVIYKLKAPQTLFQANEPGIATDSHQPSCDFQTAVMLLVVDERTGTMGRRGK